MGLRKKDTRYPDTLPFASDYFRENPDKVIQTGLDEWIIEKMVFGVKGVTLCSRSFTIFVFKSSPDYLILKGIVTSLIEENEVYFPLIFLFPNPENIRYDWDYDVSCYDKNMGFWSKSGEGKFVFHYSQPYDEGVFEEEPSQVAVQSLMNKIIPKSVGKEAESENTSVAVKSKK